jgi:acetylglutamate kinase
LGKKKLWVIKIGGNIIDDPEALENFLQDFSAVPGKKILIHGGGKLATDLSRKLNLEPKLVDGRRITDAETLKIVTMVYAGYINKNIVAKLQAHGCNATGICGADGNAMLAHKRQHPTIDFGFVGDVDTVNLTSQVDQNQTLIIAPITHDGNGNLLNTNADTIASAVATSLSSTYEVGLVFCFEKRGLLADMDNEESVISHIKKQDIELLIQKQVITGGMIPKVHNMAHALEQGVEKVILCHAKDLLSVLNGNTIFGTTFTGNEN